MTPDDKTRALAERTLWIGPFRVRPDALEGFDVRDADGAFICSRTFQSEADVIAAALTELWARLGL